MKIINLLGVFLAFFIAVSVAGCVKSEEFRYNMSEGMYYLSEAFKSILVEKIQ